jgi:catechol 2,3-dioxygenase-like lactoylglutathione lyase family enzyme
MGMKPAKNGVDIGVVVKDVARCLAFYEGVLGLKRIGDLNIGWGHMYRLGFGESQVKLVDPKVVPPAAPLGLGKALGFNYLTFPVTNLDEVLAGCLEAGAPVELPKTELLPGRFIAMVRDPDGNVVEFVQQN